MSQYPIPYSTPQYAPTNAPFAYLLGPAKRAGLLLIILGSLIIVYAACNGASTAMMSTEDVQKFQQTFAGGETTPMFSASATKTAGVIFSSIALLVGFALLTSGIFVRKGGSTATIFALALNSLLLLVAGLFLLMSIVAALASPVFLIATCIVLVAVSLLGLSEFWLIQALKVPAQIAAAQQQYQMQLWHYQQQAQQYAAGYQWSYAQQQSPPPPPTNP